MNTTVAPAAAVTIPGSIATLIAEVEALGGEATKDSERVWRFHLPVKMVGGTVSMMTVGTAGYFVRDGKIHASGMRDTRQTIARRLKYNVIGR